jgi:hypothetical protein
MSRDLRLESQTVQELRVYRKSYREAEVKRSFKKQFLVNPKIPSQLAVNQNFLQFSPVTSEKKKRRIILLYIASDRHSNTFTLLLSMLFPS